MAMYGVRATIVVLTTAFAYVVSHGSYEFSGNSSRELLGLCSWSKERVGQTFKPRFNYVLQFRHKDSWPYRCFFESSFRYRECERKNVTKANASYCFVDVMKHLNVAHCCSGQELETFVGEFAKNCTVSTNFDVILEMKFNRNLGDFFAAMIDSYFNYYSTNFLTTVTTTEEPEKTSQQITSPEAESNSAHGQFARILACSLAALGYQAVAGH